MCVCVCVCVTSVCACTHACVQADYQEIRRHVWVLRAHGGESVAHDLQLLLEQEPDRHNRSEDVLCVLLTIMRQSKAVFVWPSSPHTHNLTTKAIKVTSREGREVVRSRRS